MLAAAEPGRDVPAEQPLRARRGLGPPAARGAAADHRQEAASFYVIDAYERGARAPAWAAASTPSCRPASSPSPASCRATRPSRPSRTPSRRPTASAGEAVVQKNFAAVDAALGHLHEVSVPGAGRPATIAHAAAGAGRGARVRAARSPRQIIAGRRRRLCRSARCPPTAPSRPAPRSGRSATSPWRSRCGTEQLCIQCGKCVAGLPARGHPRQGRTTPAALARRPADLQVAPTPSWQEFAGHDATRCRSRPRTAPAAACASRSARPRTRPSRGTRPSTWRRSRRCASTERANWDFFLDLPEPDRAALEPDHGQGRAAPAAAVRVLRRLRRLRRDALPQAADASSSATGR